MNATMSGETKMLQKFEYRAVIKYLLKKGKEAKEIFENLWEMYPDSSPSYATVKCWTCLFKQGRQSIEDDEHAERPFGAVTEETRIFS